MSKSRIYVVKTILPEDAIITDNPKLETAGEVAFRSPKTGELYWLDKRIWNCIQNHEAYTYYSCEICHPYLKKEDSENAR